jgi:hypothetical protein
MGHHPLHRQSCRSWLFPAPCRHCGQDIYVYSCSCHSGRILDEDHPPWTPHDCWATELARLEQEAREQRKRKYSGSRLIKAAEWKKMRDSKSGGRRRTKASQKTGRANIAGDAV